MNQVGILLTLPASTDITLSNVLLQLSDIIKHWSRSEEDVYQTSGIPETKTITMPDGMAPIHVVSPINNHRLSYPSMLREEIVLIDFGQSLIMDYIPPKYRPGTPMQNLAPEAFFDSKVGFASDVWALACVIYKIRTGAPLFEEFFGDHDIVPKEIVETLGKFPDPWWSMWEARKLRFDEMGKMKPKEEQGSVLYAEKTPIAKTLRDTGLRDDPSDVEEGSMIDLTGSRLDAAEVVLLENLLGKMLKYCSLSKGS